MSGYIGEQQPQLSDLDRCTRCGLCEQACPTYRLLHFEPDSPRGRIFLMKQVAEGKADVDEHLADHLYRCLGCRACESVCPSSVPFGRLLEYGRYQVELRDELTQHREGWRLFRELAFKQILPSPWLFRAVMLPARMLQSMPALLAFAQSLPLPKRLAQLIRMIPQTHAPAGSRNPQARVYPAQGERRARVGMFLGCVMNSLFSAVNMATIRVLTRNGCDVVVARNQWCCGALNLHAGEREIAHRMARKNIDAFSTDLDAIIVNSAGCGAAMKEYAELLPGDASARAFAAKIKDVNEYLAAIGLRSGLQPLDIKVTYQDACHLAHGQHVRQQPRALLRQIPGIEYVEMPRADQCCGAAGVYSLTQPVLGSQILEQKLDAIATSGARVVAISNPGCAMQIQAGVRTRGLDVQVRHVVELLADSYNKRP